MIPSFDPALWRRASWTILSLAVLAFVCLGLAEQGSRGGGLLIPPDAPLPFARHRVFGLNLSSMSSVQALDWLNAAGNPSLALIVVPIDADVVESLAQDDGRDVALAAIETLRQAAADSPLALCLRRPPETVGGLGIAQAAVGAINARFPDQVVYVSACNPDAAPGWQDDIDEAVRPDAGVRPAGRALIPLAGGAAMTLEPLDDANDLTTVQFNRRAHGGYTIFLLDAADPLSSDIVHDAAHTLADTSHTALILATPTNAVDPTALVGSLNNVVLAGDELPEGFSGINAPAIRVNDQWQHSTVGTLQYLRATSSGAALAADFVGTDVYLAAIESPDSGVVNVWIDPESQSAPPFVVLDLSSTQARDVAIPIAHGLPAARHKLLLQVVTDDGQSITISGVFVTGKPATAWIGTLAAVVVLLAAIVALSERCYSAVTAIRRQTGPPRRPYRTGHPRVFVRDR